MIRPLATAEDDARERVERFLEAWGRMRDKTDVIYAAGVFPDEEYPRELLASDLRLILGHTE